VKLKHIADEHHPELGISLPVTLTYPGPAVYEIYEVPQVLYTGMVRVAQNTNFKSLIIITDI